eukprot:5125404-Pyramimonas_sp.AAC.1
MHLARVVGTAVWLCAAPVAWAGRAREELQMRKTPAHLFEARSATESMPAFVERVQSEPESTFDR